MNTFLIADTHFGHSKVLQFEAEARPFATIEEHDEALIERWNSVVRTRDTVWHLGDVLFGRHSFSCLSRLNGVKKLVMGNHDCYPSAAYLEHFNRIVGSGEIDKHLLTHIPVHHSQFHRFKANIHGHLHSRKIDDPRYVCVSVEQWNLTPVAFEEVRQK